MKIFNIKINYEADIRSFPTKTYYDIKAKSEEEAKKIALKKFANEDENDLYVEVFECEEDGEVSQRGWVNVDKDSAEVTEVEFVEEEEEND